MSADSDSINLKGKLLIAMPSMGDPRFDRAVIFMCAHSPDGSMGLIVNKPAQGVRVNDLLDQLSIPKGEDSSGMIVHVGGPVEHGRGFVLHSADYAANNATLKVDEQFGMTATRNILHDMAKGAGPDKRILALGYSGWGPGQLESEIHRNGWLTCDASPDLVFLRDDDEKWLAALASLGIDPLLLSASAGRA